MKLIMDTVTPSQTGRKLGKFASGSARRAISAIQFQSLPPANRVRLSARVLRAGAPAPGPGGVFERQISRLEEADREWFTWRFGEDA
jgi:hypothetical protein